MPGFTGNAGGRPHSITAALKAKYHDRLPELFERLFALTNSDNERTQIAAISELLDRLIGRPQVTIDATHTTVSVGELYKAAMLRANSSRASSHIVPSEQVVEGKANEIDAGNSGSVGAARE
jgi:hypothetical protein